MLTDVNQKRAGVASEIPGKADFRTRWVSAIKRDTTQ